jgi:ATP-dependent Clp protease adaptor protein ClpS
MGELVTNENQDSNGGTGVIDRLRPKIRSKIKKPTFYVVVVHNDPVTPRWFVVEILKRFFDKHEPEANRIMLLAHHYGVGVVVKLPKDLAQSKAKQVNEAVRETGYPLQFSVESE